MATLGSMIAQVLRRVQPGQQVPSLALSGNFTSGSTTMTVSDPSGEILSNLRPETVIAVDLELFYVQNISGPTVTVVPGYLASTEANHTSGALVYLNPRFSAFDIQEAINDDLNDLCSPENGLYAVNSIELSYNPATIGYDLTPVRWTCCDGPHRHPLGPAETALPDRLLGAVATQYMDVDGPGRYHRLPLWLRTQAQPRRLSRNAVPHHLQVPVPAVRQHD